MNRCVQCAAIISLVLGLSAAVNACAVLVFAAVGELRVYHPVDIKDMATTIHTHVCVAGTVTIVKREKDGDLHVRVEDAVGRFIVAEEIPRLKATGARPKLKEVVTACGVSRFDKKHGWHEVHPVEDWKR